LGRTVKSVMNPTVADPCVDYTASAVADEDVIRRTIYDGTGNAIASVERVEGGERVTRTYYDGLNRPVVMVSNFVGDINSNTPPTETPAITNAASLPPFPGAPVLSAAAVGQLPRGLSLITNLPVYVVGDVNITSDAYADPTDGARHWVPFLIGGDVVHPLSNAWDDANARWALSNGRQSIPVAGGSRTRRASVTRYYMEMLSGWGMTVATASSGGLHNFPRALEDWGSGTATNCRGTGDFAGGCPAIIHGSLVIGHNRVYTSWPFRDANGDIGRSPPRRDWGFDPHLNDLEQQPPGTPLFDVAAVRQWTRR